MRKVAGRVIPGMFTPTFTRIYGASGRGVQHLPEPAQANLRRECSRALYPPPVRSSCHLSLLSSFPPNLIIALFAPILLTMFISVRLLLRDFVFNSCRIIESFDTLYAFPW